MNLQNEKCVLIVDEALPVGIMANTAAILGMTLGKKLPQLVGQDVADRDGCLHLGITGMPLPVLKTDAATIKELRARLYSEEFGGLLVIDFSDLAQGCKTYDEYTGKMAETPQSELAYWGLAVYGDKKTVNRLAGSMPLLR